ncbi:MAG: hypothetical protein AAF170_19160, partial [Bacteroidota bacterium]
MPAPPATPPSARAAPHPRGLYTKAIRWFIPPMERDRLDLLRARLFVVLCFLVALNTGGFAALHALHHEPGNSYVVIGLLMILSGVGLGFPFLLRWGAPVRPLSSTFFAVLQLGLIGVAWFDDGLNSGSVYWLAALPLGAAFLGGTRAGWASALLSLVAVLALYIALGMGMVFPTSVPPAHVAVHKAVNLFSCIACVGALAWMYEGPLVRHLYSLM